MEPTPFELLLECVLMDDTDAGLEACEQLDATEDSLHVLMMRCREEAGIDPDIINQRQLALIANFVNQ